eukprot:403356699
MVLKQSILALCCLCVAFIPEGQAQKVLAPWCGPKTLDIRFCENDEECRYSDEYCSGGTCVVDLSLYLDDPCGWDTGNDWSDQYSGEDATSNP